jgi:hypothetical protein
LENIINNIFRYKTSYLRKNYYEFTYRDENMIRSSIINGTIKDIFNYTRYNKQSDKLMIIFKCNLIIDNVKSNIRQLLRKYDTKTKLYDIIYYNFMNDVLDENKNIQIEIGSNIYEIKNLNKEQLLEDS